MMHFYKKEELKGKSLGELDQVHAIAGWLSYTRCMILRDNQLFNFLMYGSCLMEQSTTLSSAKRVMANTSLTFSLNPLPWV